MGMVQMNSFFEGLPVLGSLGVFSHNLFFRPSQVKGTTSRLRMMYETTPCQTSPKVINIRYSNPGFRSTRGIRNGVITQMMRPIGSAAAAQMLRIFAREYCSLWFSLGGPCTVDSLSAPPGAICPSALIFIGAPSEVLLLPRL